MIGDTGTNWPANTEPWVVDALCRQTDPDAFYPEKGEPTRPAKRVCLGCNVRTECLDYALRNNERWGVWGGLSERERRGIRAQQHQTGTLDAEPDHDAA